MKKKLGAGLLGFFYLGESLWDGYQLCEPGCRSTHPPLEQVRARRAGCQNRPESLLNWEKGGGGVRKKGDVCSQPGPGLCRRRGRLRLPLVPLPERCRAGAGYQGMLWPGILEQENFLGVGGTDSKQSSPQGACRYNCYSLLVIRSPPPLRTLSLTHLQSGARRSAGLRPCRAAGAFSSSS